MNQSEYNTAWTTWTMWSVLAYPDRHVCATDSLAKFRPKVDLSPRGEFQGPWSFVHIDEMKPNEMNLFSAVCSCLPQRKI